MVVPVLAALVISHQLIATRISASGPMMDGNGLIDPVIFVLSYLSPIAGLGVIGLVFLQRVGFAKVSSVIFGSALFLGYTAMLVMYGNWILHGMSESFQLREQVWWMQPIGILWLSAYTMCLATLRAGFNRKYDKLILLIFYTCILLVLGAVLAWLFVSYDFALSPLNLFAVIPFAIACISLIRAFFIWKDDHVTKQAAV